MRKLFGVLACLLLASGGAYLTWPEQFTAQWHALAQRAENQVTAEFTTFQQIISGKLKLGAIPAGKPDAARPTAPAPRLVSQTPRGREKPRTTAARPPAIAPAPLEKTGTDPAPLAHAPAVLPAGAAPEAALGAILKHEVRENQMKEETYWTPERIQEALKNGEPKSNSAPCIMFCDKKDTTIEINMPKATKNNR